MTGNASICLISGEKRKSDVVTATCTGKFPSVQSQAKQAILNPNTRLYNPGAHPDFLLESGEVTLRLRFIYV